MGSDRAVERVELLAADPRLIQSDRGELLPALLPAGRVIVVLSELAEVVEQARGYYERVTDARGIFGPPAVLAATLGVADRAPFQLPTGVWFYPWLRAPHPTAKAVHFRYGWIATEGRKVADLHGHRP